MNQTVNGMFCELLRVALGLSQVFPYIPTDKEWLALYTMAHRQTLLGVAYNAIARLPKESQPPRLLMLLWARDAEAIRGKNRLFYQESARYTQLFAERGFRSAILKGQANARLYPDPFSRQPGDIDIYVPGGFDKVLELLHSLGIQNLEHVTPNYHDIEFVDEKGVLVEVHHKPTSATYAVRLNKTYDEILKVLEPELENLTLTPEGFYSPSIRFALLMQLVHLYKHALLSGVSLRQYMDYYMLLTHSTEADRQYTWEFAKKIGMRQGCAAIMGVLGRVFKLPEDKMLCKPSKFFSRILYRATFAEGDFGAKKTYKRNVFKRWIGDRFNNLRILPIAPQYYIYKESKYWINTISLIPERIRRRKIAL